MAGQRTLLGTTAMVAAAARSTAAASWALVTLALDLDDLAICLTAAGNVVAAEDEVVPTAVEFRWRPSGNQAASSLVGGTSVAIV